MSYNNQLPVEKQYFTNIAAKKQNAQVSQHIWLYKIFGVCYWCVEIPQCVYMEYGLKHITFYVQKQIAPLAMCYNPPLVRDKLLGAPASANLVNFMIV